MKRERATHSLSSSPPYLFLDVRRGLADRLGAGSHGGRVGLSSSLEG